MKFDRSACIEPMYSEIPFLDRFQAAKDDGFEYVEFWSWTDKDLDAVKAAAEKAGIGISGFNGDADYSLIDPTHKEKYLECVAQRGRDDASHGIKPHACEHHHHRLGAERQDASGDQRREKEAPVAPVDEKFGDCFHIYPHGSFGGPCRQR